jgi:glucosyl-3-phosphoglycerate synthase
MSKVLYPVRRSIVKLLERRAAKKRAALIDEVERFEQSLGSADEFGLRHPFTISVVIPTYLRDPTELSSYRFEVMRNELIELGQLLRRGIIDEIIVIDGSTKSSGAIDDSLMRHIVSTMNRSLSIFHDEVDLLQKYRAVRDKAVLGLYDFGVRVVHQLDPEIDRVLKSSRIVPQGLTTGKGAALWLATALSSGDVICFLDSDIRNFQGWQLAALLKPILETWKRPDRSTLYSKAYYARLAVNLDSPEKGFYKLGGRATRLFAIPLIRALSKRGALKGLERLRYPLSGEFAGTKVLFESIEFPTGYDAEIAILIQLWKAGWLERIAQVDLGLFQHFPQSDRAIHQMVKQIVQLIITELKDHVNFDQGLVDDYLAEATKEITTTQQIYEKAEVRIEIEHEVRRDFYKDTEGDKQKILAYAEELRKAGRSATDTPPIQRLPNWKTILSDERGARLRSFIRRRGTISTVELLSKEDLVSI